MSEKWNSKDILPIPNDWDNFDENKFNDWLAENINVLDDILGLPIHTETQREVRNENGKRLDILASYDNDEETEYIAIETQLNLADFSHFGRLVMYIASNENKPKIGVWIVKDAQDSHTKSIEWLNNNTLTEYKFWLLSVNTVRVGGNPVGVEIVTLHKPDDEKRELYQEKKNTELQQQSSLRETYQKFWTVFNEQEEVLGENFEVDGRESGREKSVLKNWGVFYLKNDIYIEVRIGNNRISLSISTWYKNKYPNFREWAEKLGWNYRETHRMCFVETELFDNWQDHEDKWVDYSDTIIKEVKDKIDFLDKQ